MHTIEQTFAQPTSEPFILREHRPGDMGWVVAQHGATYAREFGWDISFEALVAEAVARFLNNFDAEKERCWIAERAGENVGSVFVVNDGNGIARLRMLIVDPAARGFGLGRRLVDECLRFARERQYSTMVLWTYPILKSAVRIYEAAGFHVIEAEPEHRFGHDLVSQTWELTL
jgi:GNAT superfamily N-acetyltransferase